MIQCWLSGSVGGASPDICPLHGLDAAGEGTWRGGGEERPNREEDQLWAGLPGKEWCAHIDFIHIYTAQDAVMNEVDSGTELESQGEEEEEVAAPENKDDGEKKDDWVVKKDYIFYS